MEIDDYLKSCELCPRRCKVNRINSIGRCKQGKNIRIALSSLHHFEEPCISGIDGSGTIFFSNCNLRCVYCQNLVTAFAYVPHIIEAIKTARENGLSIPIVYNSSGYESINTIKLLEGYVDVYLPDMKYYFPELAKELSNCEDYFEVASNAIKEMYRQVGNIEMDDNRLIKKGVVIRHLILPNHIFNSKKVLKWIKDTFDDKVLTSIMAQYFPTYKAIENEDVNRKINKEEYDEIVNYMDKIGLSNGFIQDYSDVDESKYVPDFNS